MMQRYVAVWPRAEPSHNFSFIPHCFLFHFVVYTLFEIKRKGFFYDEGYDAGQPAEADP